MTIDGPAGAELRAIRASVDETLRLMRLQQPAIGELRRDVGALVVRVEALERDLPNPAIPSVARRVPGLVLAVVLSFAVLALASTLLFTSRS